jgi:hypothetical protein
MMVAGFDPTLMVAMFSDRRAQSSSTSAREKNGVSATHQDRLDDARRRF